MNWKEYTELILGDSCHVQETILTFMKQSRKMSTNKETVHRTNYKNRFVRKNTMALSTLSWFVLE